jgi:hypothetical protein
VDEWLTSLDDLAAQGFVEQMREEIRELRKQILPDVIAQTAANVGVKGS